MKAIAAWWVVGAAVAGAQAPVPTRPLGPVVATSQPLVAVREVRQLSDGRVLVNDYGAKQLLLFDSLLKTATVVLDSAGPTDRRRYGRGGGLIPYVADTTLFYDIGATAVLVLDANGSMQRIIAPPGGTAGLSPTTRPDTRGRLIYSQTGSRGGMAPPGSPGTTISVSYSVLFAFDMTKRAVDTLFWIRADTSFSNTLSARGGTPAPAPRLPTTIFPSVSGYGVMSDGTIAIVRGEDYHVDWLAADGSITRSPRIAHEWKRLTDDDKKRMADSLTVVRDSSNKLKLDSLKAGQTNVIVSYDAVGRLSLIRFSPVPGSAGASAPPRPVVIPPVPAQAMMPIPPDVLPDFMPATGNGILADQDNRLWIPRAPTSLPPLTRVFDIVDRSGKLIDRVNVDPSLQIVGFGPGGNVYVIVRDGGVGRLQRVRFK